MNKALIGVLIVLLAIGSVYFIPKKSSQTHKPKNLNVTKQIKSENIDIKINQNLKETTTLKTRINSSVELEKPKSLEKRFVEISSEFSLGNFSRIIEYHNIMSLCSAVPNDEYEFSEWILKHSGQVGLDVPFMQKQMLTCKDVPRQSYSNLETTYRIALDKNEPKAKLVLAKLIPFDSLEKILLLSDSSTWSQDAVNMLGQRSLTGSELLSHEQRVFWLTVSDIASAYGDEFIYAMENAKIYLTYEEIQNIETLASIWTAGDSAVKKTTYTRLLENSNNHL